MESVKWIIPNSQLENKAQARALFVSTSTTLKPGLIKIPRFSRRMEAHHYNKKAALLKAAFQMVGQPCVMVSSL